MTVPEGRSVRVTLWLCGALIVGGLAIAVIGHLLPVYRVPFGQASAAFLDWCTDQARTDPVAGSRYRAMFGWHYALQNAGSALVAAGASIGALAYALRRRSADEQWLRTPSYRWMFVALGIVAMLGYYPGTIYGLITDYRRQYFPACADSLGIPIGYLGVTVAVVTPILALIGGLITLGFGRLPVPLARWDSDRAIRSWVISIIFGAVIAASVILWGMSIFSSDMIAPSSVIVIYLLASSRAALLAPRKIAAR